MLESKETRKCPLYHLMSTVTNLLADLSRLHQAPVLLLLCHPELWPWGFGIQDSGFGIANIAFKQILCIARWWGALPEPSWHKQLEEWAQNWQKVFLPSRHSWLWEINQHFFFVRQDKSFQPGIGPRRIGCIRPRCPQKRWWSNRILKGWNQITNIWVCLKLCHKSNV